MPLIKQPRRRPVQDPFGVHSKRESLLVTTVEEHLAGRELPGRPCLTARPRPFDYDCANSSQR